MWYYWASVPAVAGLVYVLIVTKQPTPSRSQFCLFLNSPLQGGDGLAHYHFLEVHPSLEGRQQLQLKNSLKGWVW